MPATASARPQRRARVVCAAQQAEGTSRRAALQQVAGLAATVLLSRQAIQDLGGAGLTLGACTVGVTARAALLPTCLSPSWPLASAPRRAAPALADDAPALCDAACVAELDSRERVTTASGLQYVDIVKVRPALPCEDAPRIERLRHA